jgi:T5SS/PEP-CTERM-associated repeat protein
MAAAPSAMGNAYIWNNAAGGSWQGSANWLPNTGPPTIGDSATFALSGAYNVTLLFGSGNKADSVTVTGSASPTFLPLSPTSPGVLTVTTGAADFNVQNGGHATIGLSSPTVNVTVGDQLNVDDGILTILRGSSVHAAGLTIGNGAFNDGTVIVSDTAAFLSITGDQHVGFNGGNGILSISNGASASFVTSGTTRIGSSVVPGDTTQGLIEVNGGSLNTYALNIGEGDGGISARLHITGAGSVVSQPGIVSTCLLIGSISNNIIAADLTVEDFGTFNSATGQAIMAVENTGVINVGQNGTFNANAELFAEYGGTVNILGGTYNGASVNATVDFGGTIHIRGGLMTLATLTISDVASQVNLDGGELQISAIAGPGRIDWNSGTLTLASGIFAASSLPPIPQGGTLNTARLGAVTINGAMQQSFNSTIFAEGTTTMGNSSAVDGFASQGRLMVNGKTVTLRDANDVVFDSTSFVKLDNGAGTAGTLSAANGLTLNFGGNITGFGTVSTPNDPFKPLINNGHITGNSAAQKITLPGFVKGVGTLDNVTVTGTFSPGFSPAAVYAGSVTYAGALEIELAGTGSGQFDVIHHSGTAALGGALNVSLLSGFTPSAGNTFEIITAAGGITGTFASAAFPVLSGLMWQLDYQPNAVSLVVAVAGDYNHNGIVDAADYIIWRRMLGQTGTGLAADGNGNGQIDSGDFDVWRAHFGQTAGSGSGVSTNATVPEPASALMLLVGLLAMCSRRRAIVS